MKIDLNKYEYYIRPGYTDMRKGSGTLAFIVQDDMHLDPFSKAAFVFCGKNHRTLKAIFWDRNGWFEITKRLECRSTFKWPSSGEEARRVTSEQLIGLLKGNDVFREFENLDEVEYV